MSANSSSEALGLGGSDDTSAIADSLVLSQKEAFELALKSASLGRSLDVLARAVQRQAGADARAAIFVVDARSFRLRLAASVGMPETYSSAVGQFDIGPAAPPCGRVVFTGEPIIVEDITQHREASGARAPFPAEYLRLAAQHEIRACWCQPLATDDGMVLGTLTLYLRSPRSPGPGELSAIGQVAASAALVIRHYREREELEERSRIPQTIFENIPEGLHLVGGPPDYAFRLNSRYAMQQMGRRPEDCLGAVSGSHAEPFGLFLNDGTRPAPEHLPLYRATRHGEIVRNAEFLIERADGSRFPVTVDVVPVRDADGRVTGAINCWRDISDRKRIEEGLREADRRKDEFLATLAHELRNPLAAIGNSSEMLSQTLPSEAQAGTAVRIIRRQVRNLTRIVDDLLDVSRVAHGRIELKLQPVRLADIVTQAIEVVEPLVKERRHELTLVNHETLCVKADRARLVQCLSNILSNAAKYTEPGGEIHIESRRVGGEAVLSVKDNGAGIPGELLPHVFDLFVQNDRTLERARGGLGIGLSVVKGLIEVHGGRVSASSPGVGRGSTFEVSLPLSDEPYISPEERPPSTPKALRILIVEDNRDAAESLAMILGLVGHEVRAINDGREALEQALSFRPAVILLDIGLPGMDGYEIARRFRKESRLADVHLIAVTGYGQWEDKQRAEAAGFDEHLLKPIDFRALERALAQPAAAKRD